ncbi:hypothetical protein [Enterobacter hormaechei]|uniref:hypothetical protein n=1 Tax=Enterobacter hormaechei TaxID=158836 RepID=UPI0033451F57
MRKTLLPALLILTFGVVAKGVDPNTSINPAMQGREKVLSDENKYIATIRNKIPKLTAAGLCDISYGFEISAVKQASSELMGQRRDTEIGDYWSIAKAFDLPEEKAIQYIDYLKNNRDLLSEKYEITRRRGTRVDFMRICPQNPKNYVPYDFFLRWEKFQK